MERYQFSDQELNGLEQLPTPLVVYQFADGHVHVLAMSDGYRELFELPEREEAYRLLEQDVLMNTHPDDVERLKEAVRRFITESGRYEVIFRGKKSDAILSNCAAMTRKSTFKSSVLAPIQLFPISTIPSGVTSSSVFAYKSKPPTLPVCLASKFFT